MEFAYVGCQKKKKIAKPFLLAFSAGRNFGLSESDLLCKGITGVCDIRRFWPIE